MSDGRCRGGDGTADRRRYGGTLGSAPARQPSLSQVADRRALHEPAFGTAARIRATIGRTLRPAPPDPGGRTVDRFEPNLRIPGPTALPPSVREAGGRQMVNHRGQEFEAMLGADPRRA